MSAKLDIEEFIADYCSGVKDKDLLVKHQISAKELIGLVRRLINEGTISQQEYFDRNRKIREKEIKEEKAFLQSLSHCPVCGHIHPVPFTVCPACGAEVSKSQESETPPEPEIESEPEPAQEPQVVTLDSPPEPVHLDPPPPQPTVAPTPIVRESFAEEYQSKLETAVRNLSLLEGISTDFADGDYSITEILSQNETSVRFKAEDLSGMRPPIVIKSFSPKLVPDEVRAEFRQRVIAYQSGMSEFNLVKILGTAEIEGESVLVYEYLPSNLENLLKKNPEGLPWDLLISLLPQMFNGLGYTHMHRSLDGEIRRIAHLQLQLSKFLFDETSHVLKLDDCGAWRAQVDVRGFKQQMWEEPGIDLKALCPEGFIQRSKFLNGFFADIYAIGVVLYQLATGKDPFTASTVEDYRFAHLKTFPIPPRVHRYSIPSWLNDMILKCLEKEASRRWRSATQMELAIGKTVTE